MSILGRCNRCSTDFEPGDVRYVLNVESFADVELELEGVVVAPHEGEGSEEETLDELLERVAALDEDEIEGEVYERLRLVLCKNCRDSITASLKKILNKQIATPTHRIH